MKRGYFFFILTFFIGAARAGSVDTVSIFSSSMHKQIKAVVIKPDSYETPDKKFPVVYLLHGYDGWYSNWIIRAPDLDAALDWARKATAACKLPVEVRPMVDTAEG